jgi:hypothetical protein
MNIEISDKEYERYLNWDDATLYCQLLTIDNKNDWRMPTKDELNEIYNSKNNFEGHYYWSSQEFINQIYDNVWGQYFNHPTAFMLGKQTCGDKESICHVRPVRTI